MHELGVIDTVELEYPCSFLNNPVTLTMCSFGYAGIAIGMMMKIAIVMIKGIAMIMIIKAVQIMIIRTAKIMRMIIEVGVKGILI